MDIEKERKEFEKEAFKQSGGWATFHKAYGDVYENNQLNFGWKVWLAAKLHAVPEGFVLVPKELSDEKADDQAMFAWNFNLDLFKSDNRDMTAIQIEEFRLKWCHNKARTLQQDYKAIIEAQEQSHD
ncbi:hypothetical protein [Acinetobacter bereziniae]|uniref:hypothetical protein n=1 Tax=Acinetobacter bereziniae TaxID=106648 RepID=UPI0032153F98